ISDPAQGPRRLEGNHVEPLLRASEAAYGYFVGIDARGRWLFRKSATDTETLVLDPTTPDPTPRLPIWLLEVKKGSVGWDKENWPVIKRGGAWSLHENGWVALDEKKDAIITDLPGHIRAGSEEPPIEAKLGPM